MRAALRRLHSPDARDLELWKPVDPTCFCLCVQALAGPLGGEGEESFDFVVCTPEWLRVKHGDEAVVLGRHHILVFNYDYKRLRRQIEQVVNSAEGPDWSTVAERIARHGHWEFEDYREGSPEA